MECCCWYVLAGLLDHGHERVQAVRRDAGEQVVLDLPPSMGGHTEEGGVRRGGPDSQQISAAAAAVAREWVVLVCVMRGLTWMLMPAVMMDQKSELTEKLAAVSTCRTAQLVG